MARLLATVATGYARAVRDRTLDEQESIRRAAMVARAQAERALRDSEARFRYQATHDPLTGLPNRILFTERLAAAIDEPGRAPTGSASASSTWTGSRWSTTPSATRSATRCWCRWRDRLRRVLGEHLVARLGGDEFVILVERTACTDDAVKVAEAASRRCANRPWWTATS